MSKYLEGLTHVRVRNPAQSHTPQPRHRRYSGDPARGGGPWHELWLSPSEPCAGYPLHGVAFRNCGDATYVCVNITALHQDSSARFVFEPCWINLQIVAAAATQDFKTTSANEWLLALVPYTHGRIRFVAEATTPDEARLLGNDPDAPFLSWSDGQGIMRGP